MINKDDFVKISDYLWEIPKGFRSNMRVPARVYLSEKMLEQAFRDKSIDQLINVATLPGIVNYSIAMPDMHEGYGFPIGGVAAMNAENGVISPGGVGFDINCLHPDSIINLDFGTYLPIKDLSEKFSEFNLPLIEKKSKQLIVSKPIRFLWRLEDKFLYNIRTKSGYSIKATGDHPLYTKGGMKKAENLKTGEQLILYPFKGVPFERPKDLEIITEDKVMNGLKELNLSDNGNRWSQIINWFKEKDLINLNLRSWQMPYLIKVVGYVFGDGTVNLIGRKRKKGAVSFYGKLEDLKQIKRDLEKININSRIFTRKRYYKVKNFYQKEYKFSTIEHCLRINSTSFVLLLYLLGVPLGNKTYQEFRIPFWLWQAPRWQKRLFLAAFFGAELSKPATLNKYNFYAPTLNINKVILFKGNGITFLKEIKKLLKEFNIKTTKIVEMDKLGNKGKTIGLRFQISSSSDNLIRFFETIGFEYHREKQKLSCLAIAYLRQKLLAVESRRRVRELVKNLYLKGVPVKNMVKVYSSDFIGKRFIEHSVWSKRGEPRIAFNFMSFEEFVETNGYGDSGFVIDEIEEIEKENYKGPVYDFTINNPNHNFIANNFVVSNCGMRLLKSEYSKEELEPYLEKLAEEIQKEVPSGLGRGRQVKLDFATLDKILEGGAKKLVEQGYGEKEDAENCEANGCLEQADASVVSSHAKNRGRDQVGTLGSGNHFLEIQIVDEIFDEETAKVFGLFKNQIAIMIHTGSRGLGHQIATDYIRVMMKAMLKYKISVPDRQLAACPFNSSEGQRYFRAMSAGANYAWANRQMIAHYVRKAWKRVLGEKASKLVLLYDVAHNIAKLESYVINNKEIKLIVHRKGATRAFPPGHPEIPEKYRQVGQPVLIPGSMGTASYVLVGTEKGEEAWYSTCHGAGRTMSRKAATRTLSGDEVVRNLEQKGIIVKCYSMRGIAEEAPQAYKNIDEVVEVVHRAGLSKKVARLKPLAVVKGE